MIACDRIIHFRSREVDPNTGEPVSKVHPKKDGYIGVNVCSNSPAWKELSPMLLGPFTIMERRVPIEKYEDGVHPGFEAISEDHMVIHCTNLENFWQSSKCYNVDLDKNGNITESFFLRRAAICADPKPHRRAMPKSKGYPVTAYFNGQLFEYQRSRSIYCHLYEMLIAESPHFLKLQKMIEEGKNILILGFDGQQLDVNEETLQAAYENTERPFGHELVICSLLYGYRPWTEHEEDWSWLDAEIPEVKEKKSLSGTTRTRVRRKGGEVVQWCDVYIGRKQTMGGWNLEASPFANIFIIGKDGEREEVIRKYEEHLRSSPKLMNLLPTLQGKVLGCWCEPHEFCHGDIIIRVLEELLAGEKPYTVPSFAIDAGVSDPTIVFQVWADQLLNYTVLVVNKVRYRILEVEFYYHSLAHLDPYPHLASQQLTANTWYFHKTGNSYRNGTFKGMDIAISHGGILIRTLKNMQTKEITSGPSLCVDEILSTVGVDTIANLVARLDNRSTSSPLLHLEDTCLKSLPVSTSARVGLTLTKPEEQMPYIFKPYRFFTHPNDISKGRPLALLELIYQGYTDKQIKEIYPRIRTNLTELRAKVEEGKQTDVESLSLTDLPFIFGHLR